jgi:hypothetical protein
MVSAAVQRLQNCADGCDIATGRAIPFAQAFPWAKSQLS